MVVSLPRRGGGRGGCGRDRGGTHFRDRERNPRLVSNSSNRRRRRRRTAVIVASDAAVATPSDFHSYLCDRIGRARDRVILASLYVGVGSGTYDNEDDGGGGDGTTGCREDELLRALREPTGR